MWITALPATAVHGPFPFLMHHRFFPLPLAAREIVFIVPLAASGFPTPRG